MDGMRKPRRGNTKVYARSKTPDQTLVNLYKESEYNQENSAAQDADFDDVLDDPTSEIEEIEVHVKKKHSAPEKTNSRKHAESDSLSDANDDIEAFINDNHGHDFDDIPVKGSIKKERQKATKKEQRKHSVIKIISRILIAIILIAGLTIGALYIFKPDSAQNIISDSFGDPAEADNIYYEPLTGRETQDKSVINAGTTCIMIENSTSARPQSGLRDAGIVYEANAEGGITRFMAVYQAAKPQYVGPIRSARLTFVHFAKQYQCAYVHMGGATNAIAELGTTGYRDINAGFYEERFVSRKISPGRYAPHNVYTRFTWMDQLNLQRGFTASTFTPFSRTDPDTINEVEQKNATTINIRMSGDTSYNPTFVYDPVHNNYLRSHQRGGAHMDKAEDGALTQISPDVVIAMKVHVIPRAGDVNGYKDHETWGEGDAFVFQDGTVIAGKWRRISVNEPLKFYNSNNEEIKLNRGQTWISAYPDTNGSVNWQ